MNNAQLVINEGRLIRGAWTGTDVIGRPTACLLSALSPDVAASHNPADCPVSVMPLWMAYLTPFLNEMTSKSAWPQISTRYADLSDAWGVLDGAAWMRLDYATRVAALQIALPYCVNKSMTTACDIAIRHCERVAEGGPIIASDVVAIASQARHGAAGAPVGREGPARVALWATDPKMQDRAAAWSAKAAVMAANVDTPEWSMAGAQKAADAIALIVLDAIKTEIAEAS